MGLRERIECAQIVKTKVSILERTNITLTFWSMTVAQSNKIFIVGLLVVVCIPATLRLGSQKGHRSGGEPLAIIVLHCVTFDQPKNPAFNPPHTGSDVTNHQGPGETWFPQCIVKKNKKIEPVLVCGRQQGAVLASKNPIF